MAAAMEPSWPDKSTLARVRAATPRNLSAQKQPSCARSAPPTSRDAAMHTRQGGWFGSSQANRVVTLGESQAAQKALPLIMVMCADK
jgi:hypothetical protein